MKRCELCIDRSASFANWTTLCHKNALFYGNWWEFVPDQPCLQDIASYLSQQLAVYLFRTCIDNIITSPAFPVEHFIVKDISLSDHKAIWGILPKKKYLMKTQKCVLRREFTPDASKNSRTKLNESNGNWVGIMILMKIIILVISLEILF